MRSRGSKIRKNTQKRDKNELRIQGLRACVRDKKVRFQSACARFEKNAASFKHDLAYAVGALNAADGAVEILGDTPTSLVIGRRGKNTFVTLTTGSDVVEDIRRWSGCL